MASYGFDTGAKVLPNIQYANYANAPGGAAPPDGVGFTSIGAGWNLNIAFQPWNFADTVALQRGRHSLKFGGTRMAQLLNASNISQSEQAILFQPNTGATTDPGLTPRVGSSMANRMLGAMNYAKLAQHISPLQDMYLLKSKYSRSRHCAAITQNALDIFPYGNVLCCHGKSKHHFGCFQRGC